jgi:hypothetical protein
MMGGDLMAKETDKPTKQDPVAEKLAAIKAKGKGTIYGVLFNPQGEPIAMR